MTDNHTTHLPDVAQVRGWVESLRTLTETVTAALADVCQESGKLNAAALDQQQIPSFELAWATAELLAAESGLQAMAEHDDALNTRLVLIYSAEAMVSIRDRLEAIMLELGLSDDELHRLINQPALKAFRQQVLGTGFLHETARLMAEAPMDIARLSGGELAISDDAAMVQDMFVKFARDVVAPLAESIHRHDLIVPEGELLQPLREMGVFGLSVPEQYGGSAPDERDDNLTMVVVTEALSEASLAAAGSLITRPEILSRALLSGGTEAQKQHWLPRIAVGDPLCGIAITEPDYGSDVASLSLRGTKTEGGWLLNGAKTWCTFAGKAGVLMVVTRTDPDKSKGYKGLSLLLAEKPAFEGHEFTFEQPNGGKLIGKAIPTIGYRGMHSFDLSFDNFFVPDQNVIGEEGGLGKGFYYTMSGMMGGRMQTAARASGVMRAGLLAGLQYAQDRKVFASPLLDYPLTGAKLAKMAARYTVSRFLAYTTARVLDGGGGRMEASLVKLFACRSAELITRESLQIHGGMGYAEETPISRYFVDARVLSIFEGAEETLALKVIARSLLEMSLAKAAA
ncbi:acyl-CoA/acyl-ACP dehydrogenase [Pseudomaricurvus alcaniphilus]|uniref:acyl-CoA dehydrogenase family protein n=1 Tax=Pseudomaricurvus alcaniphilus TaxID=1166482 RepID=UPI0014087DB2|nr:acyl-CoA dehydrogenase family protein [Pseudomaricurvus alcaniphilus]NHN39004.1 acyl-CoA/acyl-ACP dehydrogenase [Pseudomaricurvus alcaniphilus]